MVFQPVIPIFAILGLVIVGLAGVSFLIWKNKSQRKWWIFRAVYVLLVGVMLLRPSVPAYQDVEVYTNQYDIYFIVDTTASMVAEDWVEGGEQTRLDGVKQDIQNLAMSYTSAKFSLMRLSSQLRCS